MEIQEIKLEDLVVDEFIKQHTENISNTVGSGRAITALSGGVDSSTTTMLVHRALGKNLLACIIDNGLMREGELHHTYNLFKNLGINVELVDSGYFFYKALKGLKDPEEKRKAITKAFYKDAFGLLVKQSSAKYLLQGTNYTDVEETVKGIKRQHNILEQLGIDTEKEYGYKVIEPLIQLRKPAIRKVAKYLGLPEEIYNRQPFPGPALATRIQGEVTRPNVDIIRKATKILEDEIENLKELGRIDPFQYLAILKERNVTGIVDGKRKFGKEIEIRCWDSKDAVTATPTKLPDYFLAHLAKRITTEVPGIVSVTRSITPKPPSTIEAI